MTPIGCCRSSAPASICDRATRAPGEVTVVLHGGPIGLALSHPLVPLIWLATAPAARRYVAGWAGREELHTLAPSVLRARIECHRLA